MARGTPSKFSLISLIIFGLSLWGCSTAVSPTYKGESQKSQFDEDLNGMSYCDEEGDEYCRNSRESEQDRNSSEEELEEETVEESTEEEEVVEEETTEEEEEVVEEETTEEEEEVVEDPPEELDPAANGDPNVKVFRIAAGTGTGPWNTAVAPMNVEVGNVVRIVNDDTVDHRLHTGGRPCPHGSNIAPGATYDCIITQTINAGNNPATYDHNYGSGASFFINAAAP